MSLSEQKILVGVEVFRQSNAVNVRWDKQILRDGEVVVSEPFRRAYGQYDREQFLLDMTDEPTAVTYADLAGLEVRPVVIEPATTEPEPITE